MNCPFCGSNHVHRSRGSDMPLFRLMLLARVRCYDCLKKFFAPFWRIAS